MEAKQRRVGLRVHCSKRASQAVIAHQTSHAQTCRDKLRRGVDVALFCEFRKKEVDNVELHSRAPLLPTRAGTEGLG